MLIADDEPGVRIVIERLLVLEGFEVACASDGTAALAQFQPGRFDLVITDRSMPGLPGEELATALKELQSDLPIIMITGFPHLLQRPELFAAVLRKPFARGELLGALERAFAAGDAAPAVADCAVPPSA